MATIYRRTVQKGLNDPDNHDSVITHLEPDKLECEVKGGGRVLGNITTNKVSGGDGILAELFQIPEAKVLHSIFHQTWKTQE